MSCDGKVLGDRGVANRWVWEEGSRLGEIVLTRVSNFATFRIEESYIATFAIIVGGSLRLGYGSCVGLFVVDSSQGVRVSGGVASRTEIGTHPDCRVGWACSRHDDIGTLTNTQSDHVGCIWNDGYEIVGNNGHVEAINSETLNAFSAAVDEPEPVLLAGLELEFRKAGIRCALLSLVCELSTVEAHFAVDQIAVRERRKWVERRGHDFLDDLFVGLVVPIAEHDWSNVNVICCLGWSVNDHRSCETGRVLSAIMRVIPRCAENIRNEGISHACSGGDRALVDSRHAIVPRSSLLK